MTKQEMFEILLPTGREAVIVPIAIVVLLLMAFFPSPVVLVLGVAALMFGPGAMDLLVTLSLSKELPHRHDEAKVNARNIDQLNKH